MHKTLQVGEVNFIDYINCLPVPFYRLVNTEDTVPKLPGKALGYRHTGTAVSFTVDYGSAADNHANCCCYSYAVTHPEDPENPDFESCME